MNTRHHHQLPQGQHHHSSGQHREFEQSRRACDPFEALGEGRDRGLNNHLFMNRSAIKLANIDALLGFCLTPTTSTLDEDHNNCIQNDTDCSRTLVFADLCGAPGGFSEYIQWRCHSFGINACWGYGMSLMGTNEQGSGLAWKLHDEAYRDSRGMYTQYRICSGVDGSGDIHRWENVQHLQQMIHCDNTQQLYSLQPGKVHLVVADGGFDSQRDAENQEEVAQKLVVCEVAAALALLERGGIFVLKLFGAQTMVVRTVLRHLWLAFDSLVLVKPIASRPASAERYLVCAGFRGNPTGWDGRRWCSQMLLGQHCHASDFPSTVANYQRAQHALDQYLDEFDRDMLHLNLKACFAILSYLENKCQRLLLASQNATAACMDADDDSSSDANCTDDEEPPRVNIASYRLAWRLG